jgi:Flp pilus assembly pilin Flp
MKIFNRSIKDQKGAAAVEFALILPLVALIIFGIIDFGRLFFVQMSLTSASQEVARKASFYLESYECPGTVLSPTCANPTLNQIWLTNEIQPRLIASAPMASLYATFDPESSPTLVINSACSLSLPNKSTVDLTLSTPFVWILPFYSANGNEVYKVKSRAVVSCQL